MSGNRYREEFKIEAVKQVLIALILFPAWPPVSVSPLTVSMPG